MRNSIRLLFATLTAASLHATAADTEPIKLPDGFALTLYASGVDDARSLALGGDGTVYVSTRKAGKIYALLDPQHRQHADEVVTIASDLDTPNGIALHNGALYVVERSRILRYTDIAKHLRDKPKPEVLRIRLPKESHHGWRYARFGPDGKLYFSIGAPCNICKPDPDKYAMIARADANGTAFDVYARGVRNSIGFDWDPRTKHLWFTDNGRDWLGDDSPPDELNHASTSGLHFGYPYCHGGDLTDPQYGKQTACSEFTAPAVKLAPHAAALGMRFYTGRQFPERYRNGIFIAEHGSWNRSEPIGYRVMFVPFKDGKPSGYEVFAEGWLHNGQVTGRPVDVLVMPDGALLVSDDYSGTIYRITYSGHKPGSK